MPGFAQMVRVPLNIVEADKCSASFKNGVLTVTLPKPAGAQAKSKSITVNAE